MGLPSHWGGLGGLPLDNFQEIKGVLVHSEGFWQPELGIITIKPGADPGIISVENKKLLLKKAFIHLYVTEMKFNIAC